MRTGRLLVVAALAAVSVLVACGDDVDVDALAERHNATVDGVLDDLADTLADREEVTDVSTTATDDPPANRARSDISVRITTSGADTATLVDLVGDVARRLWQDEDLLLVGPLSVSAEDTETGAEAGLGEVLGGDGATAFFDQLETVHGERPVATP